MYTYKVDCWVRPRSGFDLANKNSSFKTIREVASRLRPPFKNVIEKMISKFEKVGEGLVIKSFILESDSIVVNAEKEILPEIHKQHPEAQIISWSLLPITKEHEPKLTE